MNKGVQRNSQVCEGGGVNVDKIEDNSKILNEDFTFLNLIRKYIYWVFLLNWFKVVCKNFLLFFNLIRK